MTVSYGTELVLDSTAIEPDKEPLIQQLSTEWHTSSSPAPHTFILKKSIQLVDAMLLKFGGYRFKRGPHGLTVLQNRQKAAVITSLCMYIDLSKNTLADLMCVVVLKPSSGNSTNEKEKQTTETKNSHHAEHYPYRLHTEAAASSVFYIYKNKVQAANTHGQHNYRLAEGQPNPSLMTVMKRHLLPISLTPTRKMTSGDLQRDWLAVAGVKRTASMVLKTGFWSSLVIF
ncbi:hypothetical protein NFI96_009992 [Prochilodus magdalenae]|nr:hypothetical protein NFI96_009992 [Prochilodus magdalenae]